MPGTTSAVGRRARVEGAVTVAGVKLADRIAQCRTPFVIACHASGGTRTLNNAAECAHEVSRVPIRFVLSDDLTRLCTALAYSKGARTLACADLIRVPAESVWIEWPCRPWQHELSLHAISVDDPAYSPGASPRRAISGLQGWSSRDLCGRSGRAMCEGEVLASCIEAYFDLDTPEGEEPEPPAGWEPPPIGFFDPAQGSADMLSRCFRFRYEPSWQRYYGEAALDPSSARRCGVMHWARSRSISRCCAHFSCCSAREPAYRSRPSPSSA